MERLHGGAFFEKPVEHDTSEDGLPRDPRERAPIALRRAPRLPCRLGIKLRVLALCFTPEHALLGLGIKRLRNAGRATDVGDAPNAHNPSVRTNCDVKDIVNVRVLRGLCAHAVDRYAPGLDGLLRERARLEKPRRPKPLVQARRDVQRPLRQGRRSVSLRAPDQARQGKCARLLPRSPSWRP